MTFHARMGIGIGIFVTLGAAGAFAQVAGNPSEVSRKTDAKPGSTVVIDPVTHQIRQATAAELADLTKADQQRQAGQPPAPKMFAGPGGSLGVVLDDSTMSYMVVTKRPDGKLDMDCVTGGKASTDRVVNPKPAVSVAPKKEVLDVK